MKYLIVFLILIMPYDASARVVKLGSQQSRQNNFSMSNRPKTQLSIKSCLTNEDCPFDKECTALRCESICKYAICDEGTHCGAIGEKDPHKYGCYECTSTAHCEKGMFCDIDRTCKKPDPCKRAICSPAAPFCSPEPYESLPYTCVQCLETAHCPPIGGLTRSCVDGFCLFNIEGNIPSE